MPFNDNAALLSFAQKFVGDRVSALKSDVGVCLGRKPYATFAVLLSCFSTIDLLAALCSGEAARDIPVPGKLGKFRPARTTANAKHYMTTFMLYTDEQAAILQALYRHKTVHLAQPGPIVVDAQGRRISWLCNHTHSNMLTPEVPRSPMHLTVQPSAGATIPVADGWTVPCDHLFWVSLNDLLQDVVDSVHRPSTGYLSKLSDDADLQAKFSLAIEQIYDATPVSK